MKVSSPENRQKTAEENLARGDEPENSPRNPEAAKN